MQLLIHIPSSQKFASDHSSADYSLRLIDQITRHSWLFSLILILYKYMSTGENIRKLILIVITTLELHCHVCNFYADLTNDEKSTTEYPRPIEYEVWTDSSMDEMDETKELIEEESFPMTDTSPKKQQSGSRMPRPNSLSSGLVSALKNNDAQQVLFTKVVIIIISQFFLLKRN